ncbi:MAG: tripartite tricarboxylate transporter TctB family protein [Lawsonibacter sp.]
MHKGDTIPGLITAIFGYSVAIYTLVENTMRFNAQSSDGVPGAGFFPVLLGFLVGILGTVLTVRGIREKGTVRYFQVDAEVKHNLKVLGLAALSMVLFFILWQTTKQFIVCMAAVCFALNLVFGRKLIYNLIYTAVFTAFIYGAFILGFSVQFNM